MAKKIVRGITDVKTINNQDYDTNNVNDLLSDGQYNYIHRKKGETEEYHNLTDNIKTLSSDNTELLEVTNNNKTTNTATLHPKHDSQKEQVIDSTRDTITIHHGENGTAEKTTVDTNPQKVLEHANLISNSQYVTIEHEEDSNTSEIRTDNLVSKLNELDNKIPTSVGVRNLLEKTNQGKTNWAWEVSVGETTAENYDVNGVNAVKLTRTSDASFTWHYIAYYGLIRKLIEPNTKYTLSFDVKPNVDVTFSAALQLGEGGAMLTDAVKMNKALANQWTKVSCVLTSTTTLPSHLSQVVYLEGMPVAKDNYLIIKNIKLEKGVVSSDWSPAPEDIYPLLAQKEQVLESTRNTVTIHHGTNGTAEKTTVDTNPQKVLEHENLISDSEYITLDHQTDVNKTHIKTESLKQELDALYEAISSIDNGPRHTINYISSPDFSAVQHTVSSGDKNVVTFSFECYNTAETVLTGPLKQQLGLYVLPNTSISNSTITISNDGTTMKLINSAPSENVRQHATFTFYYKYEPVEPGEPGGELNPD